MNEPTMPDGTSNSIYEFNDNFRTFDIKASADLSGLMQVSPHVFEQVESLEVALRAYEDVRPMDHDGMKRLEEENAENPVGNAYFKLRRFLETVYATFKLGEYAGDIIGKDELAIYDAGLEMLKNEEIVKVFRLSDKARKLIETTKNDLGRS
jgi:hypothetical protein